MLGVAPWNGLGLAGNALALTARRGVGLVLHLALWRRRMGLLPARHDWWHCPARALLPVLRIGVPGAPLDIAYRLAFPMALAAAARHGVEALATQAYVLQTLRFVLLIGLAIGWACEIMVGHLYGLVGTWIAYIADEWIGSAIMFWRWETHGWRVHARAIQHRLRTPALESRY